MSKLNRNKLRKLILEEINLILTEQHLLSEGPLDTIKDFSKGYGSTTNTNYMKIKKLEKRVEDLEKALGIENKHGSTSSIGDSALKGAKKALKK
jgi:hypothetical protein